MAPLFGNIGEQEKQKWKHTSLFIECSCFKSYIATAKWHCAIAKWVGLSLPSSSSLLTSCENSSDNLVSLWLIYPGNKYNVSRFVSG